MMSSHRSLISPISQVLELANDTAGWKACFQVSASTVQSHDADSITTEEDTDIYIFYENISIDESRCKQMQGS